MCRYFFLGTLIQILDKPKGARSRLSATFGGKSGDKEVIRQCFLFSNHLLLTTRQSDDDGRLNLVPQIGKIPLSDAVLVEDPNDLGTADDDGIKNIIILQLKLFKTLLCDSMLCLIFYTIIILYILFIVDRILLYK